MRTGRLLLLCLLIAVAQGICAKLSAQDFPVGKDLGRSKQFIVYCDDPNARSRVVSACDDIKERLLRSLDIRDEWKLPIVVVLRVPATTDIGMVPASFKLYQSVTSAKLQIDLNVTKGFEQIRLADLVTEALLTELVYREAKTFTAGTPYQKIYTWVIEGLSERLARLDHPFPPELLTAILQASQSISFRDFLAKETEHLDSVSREIYRVYAMTLVEMLFSQPGGRTAFVNYLKTIPSRNPNEMFQFAGQFKQLNGSNDSLEKWWSITLAKLSTSERFLPLTPETTEQKLNSILTVSVPESFLPKPKKDKKAKEAKKEEELEPVTDADEPAAEIDPTEKTKTFAPEQFDELMKMNKARRRAIFGPVLNGLYGLGTTAHPMYYVIVGEYQRQIGLLAEGKSKGSDAEFERLSETRRQVLAMYENVDDYLNWFEATQMDISSHAFDHYTEAAKEIAQPWKPRNDPVTRYLEIIENEMK